MLVKGFPAEGKSLVHIDSVVTIPDGSIYIAEELLVGLNRHNQIIHDHSGAPLFKFFLHH